jgi:hypothetical protein
MLLSTTMDILRWSSNLPNQILIDAGMMAKDHMIWLQRAEFMANKLTRTDEGWFLSF